MRSKVEVVAFDVDGTLYGRGAYFLRMAKSAFSFPLLSLRYARARKLYRKEQGSVSPPSGDRAGYLSRLADLMGGERERTIASVERCLYGSWRRSYRNVRARRDAVSIISALKEKGLRVAVLSDFPLEGKLEALGIAPLVDVALSSEDTGYLKPDGRAFEALAGALGCDGDRILFVGDSREKDVLGSRRAGMVSCLLAQRGRRCPEADYVVHSFRELGSLFS